MKKFSKLFISSAALFLAIFAGSCEIGMGAAVDTEPPVFTINYPPTSAVVRGSFLLAGTCTDDLENDHVEINVRNVDTGMQWGPYTASVNDNKWTLELNKSGSYNGYEYPDGQYVFSGVGVDKSGRSSGSTSASFYIDNTAPVLILSKPMAIGSETPTKFGKSINLIGDLADDHQVTKLNLHYRQYKEENGSKIWVDSSEKVLTVTGFSGMSSDNPLVIAKYYTQAEIDAETDASQKTIMRSQRDNYLKIYGEGADESSPEDRKFYASFELEDEAKSFRNPGDSGSGSGNVTGKYYINSNDFYDNVTKALELSAFSIKKIVNGTSTASVNGNTPTQIISLLNGYAQPSSSVSTSYSSSVFIVNPDNSPNYSITGYKLQAEDSESSKYKSFAKDQDKFSLSIVAGKDNANVKPSTIGVYLYHLNDEEESLNAVKARYASTKVTDPDAAKKIKYELVAPGEKSDNPNTSLNYTVILKDIITAKTAANPEFATLWNPGDFYLLEVIGKDENSVDLTADVSVGYGFQAYVNAEAPKITFTTQSDKYYKADEIKAGVVIDVEIEIDANFADDKMELYDESKTDDLKNRITIKKVRTDKTDTGVNIDSENFDTSKIVVTKPATATHVANTDKYTLQFTIGGENSVPTTLGKYKYSFYLSYKDKNAKTTTESFAFYVDNKAPEVNISSIGPTVSKKDDTKTYINGDLLITGYIQDNNKISDIKFYKYQIPAASLSNYDLSTITPTPETITVNSPYYSLSKSIDTTALSDGSGIVIKIEAEDSVGNKAEVYESPLYVIDQTTDKPVISGNNFSEVSKKDNAKVLADKTVVNIFDENATLIGSITDDDGIDSATLQIKDENGNDLTTPVNYDLLARASQTSGTKSITFSGIQVPSKAGYYQLIINANDIGYSSAASGFEKYHTSTYGEGASDYVTNDPKVVWFAVDNADPEFTESTINTTETQYKNSTITFGGTIKDDWKLADTPITVKVDGTALSNPSITYDNSKNPPEWTYTHSLSGNDGKYKFEFIAADATGKTAKVERTVLKDTKVPAFGTKLITASPALAAKELAPYVEPAAINDFYNKNTLTIKGGVSDSGNNNSAGSGIDKVTVSIDGATAEDVIVANDGSFSYIYNITGTDKTASSVVLTVYDKSGNSANATLSLKLDYKNPTLSLTQIDGVSFVSGTKKKTNARNKIELKGTVADEIPTGKTASDISGIDRILILANNSTFKDGDGKETSTVKVSSSAVDSSGNWTAELSPAILTGLNDSNTIYARVVDKAGNYSDYTLFTLEKDAEKPTVEFDSLVTAKNGSSDVYVNGTFKISGNSSDNAGLASIDLCYYIDREGYRTWKPLHSISAGSLNNWNVEIDTTNTISGKANFGTVPDGSTVYICAIVSDEGGNRTLDTVSGTTVTDNTEIKNFGTDAAPDYHRVPKITPTVITTNNPKAITKVIVDQDTDRPIIKFNNIDLSGMDSDFTKNNTWLKNTNKLIGLVSDDDGEVTYLGYLESAPTFVNGEATNTFTQIPLSSGSWELSLSDGQRTVWFKVTDKNSKNFYSCSNVTDSNAPNSLKLYSEKTVDGTKTETYFGDRDATGTDAQKTAKYNSTLYYKVDQTAPTVSDIVYYSFDKTKATNGAYETDVLANLKFGGNHQKFKVEFGAYDINGIDSVYIYQDSNENGKWDSGEPKVDGTVNSFDSTKGYNPCVITDYDISELRNTTAKGLKGSEKFVLAVIDKAGLISESTFQINIDNEAPGITVESHNNNAQIRKEFILNGNTSDSDIGTKIKYIINASNSEPSATDWASAGEIIGGVQSWYLYVDGDINNEDGYTHTKHHKDIFVELYASKGITRQTTGDKLIVNTSNGDRYTTIQPFYVHLQVTDSYGNSSTTTRILNVDPQGDMPIVELLYPAVDKYGWYSADATENWIYTDGPGTSLSSTMSQNGKTYTYRGAVSTLSGIIRAQGTSEGENGIYGVYMQIDPAYNPTTGFSLSNFTARYSASAENLLTKYKTDYTTSTKTTELTGLYIGDNPSWNYAINQAGELNGSNGENNYVAIRLYAVDKKGNISTTNPLNDLIIVVDSAKPKIGSSVPFSLFRWVKADGSAVYATAAEAGANAVYETKEYQNDMWVTGQWWLKGSVEDENGISEILFDSVANAETDPTTSIKAASGSVNTWGTSPNTTSGYVITQPVGDATANSYGKLTYKLKVTDLDDTVGSGNIAKTSEKVFTINYDNKAPTLEEKDGDNYSINEKIVNDNGVYKVTSGATEESGESGFARAVVYFKRVITTPAADAETSLFDTYIKREATGNKLTVNSSLKYEDGLYWKTNTVTAISGKNITVTADVNIHKGGLVKFGGSYYTITEGNGTATQLTLDSNPPADLVNKQILFAIGNVIDHKGTETSGKTAITTDEGYGYFAATKDNTDDFMVEKVSTIGTKTVWSGSINSMNMTDGPVEVHYVVFDQAGNYFDNYSASNVYNYTVEGIVSNNAPRLASVRVVSPYTNEDKTKYYSEIWRKVGGVSVQRSKEVTSNLKVAEKDDDDNLTKAFITAKSDLKLYPEIVGGNGDLYYSIGDAATGTKLGKGHNDYIDSTVDANGYYIEDDNKSGYINGHTGYLKDGETEETLYEIPVSLTGKSNSSTDTPTWFTFKIWDSTKGTTLYTNSLNATIELAVNVHVTDASVPKVAVKPFYWNGLNDNSIYGSSDTTNVKKQSDLKGHIELEADWEDAAFESDKTTIKASHSSLAAGLKDKDPKVSGQITITGYAYDDIELKELYVKFDGLIDTETKVATYSRAKDVADGLYKGTWTLENAAKDYATNHWSFSVKDEATDTEGYFTGEGHKANWVFNIDTSYITGVAGLDKSFTIKAKDKENKESVTTEATSDTSDAAYNKPSYQMDVVPYITHVTTSLSSKNTNNPTVYDRTALGKYPVYNGEKVTVEGFNLAAGSTSLTNQTPAKGKWSVTTNSIPTLNNLNKAGIDSNKQPNNKNNNILTDDVEFDVWQFNNKAVVATAGKVNNPVMKISPTSGMIGFAFSNGAERFSMGGTVNNTEYSYRKWNMTYDYMKHNEFVYDSTGHTYGTTVGGDIAEQSTTADVFSFMTDRWGVVGDSVSSNYGSDNHRKLETISQNNIRDKDRIQSPSLATLRNSDNNGTYVYLSYFDKVSNEIRFKSGLLYDNNNNGDFGNFKDNGSGNKSYSSADAQIIAKASGNLGTAGAYTAVGVTSENVVVLIWYDGNNLQFVYNTKATTVTNGDVTSSNQASKGWVGPTQLLTGAGEYCKLVVDSDNNVHVAAYDSTKNDLKYVYIPYDSTNKVPKPADKKVATVDSLNDLGEDLTIDVAKSSFTKKDGTTASYQIPYIGYWGSYPALPRLASIADPEEFYAGTQTNGTVKDKYTGVWECSIVPTKNAVQNTVNVGVWKSSGVLAQSNGGTNKWSDSTADGTSGKCYGNGTSNPVMGYLVSPSSAEQYIETAQKM